MIPEQKRYRKNAVIVFITIFSIFAFSINGLSQDIEQKKIDTLKILQDSTSISQDTINTDIEAETTKLDSAELYLPLPRHGSVFLLNGDEFKTINKRDLEWTDYYGFSDILGNNLPSTPLYLGGFFHYNQLMMFGTGHRNISFRYNNRPINDVNFGTYNIDLFPPEFMENIEILIGSDAVIFSNNSSGALINIQEIKYNTAKPYTKLWINEAGATFIGSDGVFSQNVMSNVNVTVGFRKVNSKNDFQNQWTDSWNLRGLVRWNLSDRTNISFSEIFTNHAMGTNGGVNKELSADMFNPIEAIVLYDDFNERLIRHDITATLSSFLDADSSSSLSISGFFTYADMFRRIPALINGSDSVEQSTGLSSQFGASGKFEQELTRFISLKIGGDIIYSSLEETRFNESMNGLNLGAFGYIGFRPVHNLLISGGLRTSSQLDRFYNTIGGKIKYFKDSTSTVFGDISISQRVPTPAEGLGLKNENHFLIIGGIDIERTAFQLNSSVFFRTVGNPIKAETVLDNSGNIIDTRSFQEESLTSTGISTRFSSSFLKNFYYMINANISFDNWAQTASFANPRIFGGIKFYYRISLGRSEVRFGFDVNTLIQQSALRYLPQRRQYTLIENEPSIFYDGLNVFAHAKLGNAYVKINFRNLMGAGYYNAAYYPIPTRILNISVNWAFLD